MKFAESAGQAVDPAGFGDYAKAKATIDKQLGVSLDDDLIGQLTGDVSASISLDGKFGVRADLKDPQAFKRTLAKVADVLPSFAEGAGFGKVTLAKPKGGQKFYALAQPDGDRVVFGVVDDVLVVANDPARADDLASAQPTAVPGAKGSVVLSADAQQIVNTLLGQFGAGAWPGRPRWPRRRPVHAAARRPQRVHVGEHRGAARKVHAGDRLAPATIKGCRTSRSAER